MPPFETYKLIPLSQIMWIIDNPKTIDIEKCVEVFLRIVFRKLKPTPEFSFEKEIAKIEVCSKFNSFKKLYVKKLYYSVGCIKCQSDSIQKEQKNINVIDMLQKESIEKIHSEYFPYLTLFHDKLIILTMKEIVEMMKMVRVSKRFFDSLPKKDFKKITWLLCSNNIAEIPHVKEILRTVAERKKPEEQDPGCCGWIGDRLSTSQEDGSGSLFNFSNHLARMSVGGLSYTLQNIGF